MLLLNIEQGWACQHEFDASTSLIDGSDFLPGDTVCLKAGNWNYIQFRNIQGTEEQPIIIRNSEGAVIINTDWYYGIKLNNCKHLKITGTGEKQFTYGIVVQSVANQHGCGMTIDAMSTNVEVEFVEISNTGIAGIYAKTEPDYLGDCTFPAVRDSFTMYNTIIHHCYLHDIGDEGFYIGSSKYSGQTVYHCGDTIVLPHVMIGVKIYNNVLENIGWDGIQVGSAVKDCEIFNNTVIHDSQEEEDFQMSGILIGGGSACDCYNNKIIEGKGDGIDFLGLEGIRIFNNLIVSPGYNFQNGVPADQHQKHGIWVGELQTANEQEMNIYNNTIISPRTFGIKLANTAFTGNIIRNNIISDPGGYPVFGEASYINLLYPSISVTQSNNLENTDTSLVGFVNPAQHNYDLHYYSPAVNTGADVSHMNLVDDLLSRFRPFDSKYDIGAYECQDSILFAIDEADAPAISHRIYPNPAGDETMLSIYMNKKTNLHIEILDNLGNLQKSVYDGPVDLGRNIIKLELHTLEPGHYIYCISSEEFKTTGKLIIK